MCTTFSWVYAASECYAFHNLINCAFVISAPKKIKCHPCHPLLFQNKKVCT
ncbi:hypothetical protein JHK82_025933 [Glycine max]|nr:hypothetical protein JHK87_025874 [Glycine soja]KAG5013799.1 hypothetical protein JHK86_026060 [Glycine max]KAG5134745.1 hypothetical protein JHK82_025933 [Glycine max]KAH1044356.1 hypothetical protein GYH30_025902 [Glycine max]